MCCLQRQFAFILADEQRYLQTRTKELLTMGARARAPDCLDFGLSMCVTIP